MNILELQSDPNAFRNSLLIDTDTGPRPFADCKDDWQEKDFRALDSGWKKAIGQESTNACSRGWLERARGHSKTFDLAVMSVWALFASRRQLSGIAGAGDHDQARLLRDAIGKLLYTNPWLSSLIEVQNYRVLNKNTGSVLEIISSDAPTSYGLTPDFVIADEVSHWKKRDLWDSLLSSAAKRANCMFVVITNAGLQDDWAWETREAVRTDPSWYFSRLDGPVATWITPDRLAEQERLLPSIAYRRLWLNEWTSGGGDALTPDLIESAFSSSIGPLQSAEEGYVYTAGIDLGVTRDASAVCILGVRRSYEGHGRIRLAYTRLWRPSKGNRVNLQDVQDKLFELHNRFKLKQLNYDPWEARHLASQLQAGNFGILGATKSGGLPMREITQTGKNLQAMATTLIEAFNDHRLELYEEPDLRRDLHRLRVVERSYGFRLESPRDSMGHGDMATAFSLALLAASGLAAKRRMVAGAYNGPTRLGTGLFQTSTPTTNDNNEGFNRALSEMLSHEPWKK